jgi:hypothetical protein
MIKHQTEYSVARISPHLPQLLSKRWIQRSGDRVFVTEAVDKKNGRLMLSVIL